MSDELNRSMFALSPQSYDRFRQLEKENADLRAEVALLELDKGRIDKLEKLIQNENDLDICKRADGYWVTEIFRQHPDNKPYPTLRAAIDKAGNE